MVPLAVLHGRRQLLRVHRSGKMARARTTHVCHLRRRREVRLPPGASQPITQIHFLVVHEERWVEPADAAESRHSERERGTRYPWDDACVLMGIAREVQLSQARNTPDGRTNP